MTGRSKSILKNFFWIVAAGALGVLSLSAANFKKQGVIKGVAVEMAGSHEGESFMRPENIEKEIMDLVGPLEKQKVGEVSCDRIEDVLGQNPFIEAVEVYVNGNDILTARIAQKSPVLRVLSEGKSFYLDDTGQRMPTSPYYSPRVQVATGPMAAEHAEDLLPVVDAIQDDKVLNALIGQLHYAGKNEIILMPAVGRGMIYFGGPELIAEKFENLKTFYRDVVSEAGWDHYRSIDLRYRNQIICKKNPTS